MDKPEFLSETAPAPRPVVLQRAVDADSAIIEADPGCIITHANDKFCKISGYRREELLGLELFNLSSTCHPQGFLDGLRASIAQGNIWSGEISSRAKDGNVFWQDISVTPVAGVGGKPAKFLAAGRDISTRKLVEGTLWQQAQLIDQSHDAIFSMDFNGTVLSWNGGAERLFGYSREEVFGKSALSICREGGCDALRAETLHALKEKGADTLEIRLCRKSGERFDARISLSLLKDFEGAGIGVVGHAMDITERKHSEQELIRSRRQLQELSIFLQTVREEERKRIARELHDELGQTMTALRFDLNWINGRLSGQDNLVSDKISAMNAMVNQTVDSIRRIAEDLRPGMLDDLGIAAAIEHYVAKFAERTGIACELLMSQPDFDLDDRVATALFRIVQESLTNVVRHSGATQLSIHLHEPGERILLIVQDNGHGFQFGRDVNKKTYGLMGMRERVNMLDGTLDIFTEPGSGVRIEASIPKCIKEKE